MDQEFIELCEQRWSKVRSWESEQLKFTYDEFWVRFHNLSGSKRYAENEHEYALMLERYNTVLEELFSRQGILVMTSKWSDASGVGTSRTPWLQATVSDEPGFERHASLFLDRTAWTHGVLDGLRRNETR